MQMLCTFVCGLLIVDPLHRNVVNNTILDITHAAPSGLIIIIQFKNHLAANYFPKETFAFLKQLLMRWLHVHRATNSIPLFTLPIGFSKARMGLLGECVANEDNEVRIF